MSTLRRSKLFLSDQSMLIERCGNTIYLDKQLRESRGNEAGKFISLSKISTSSNFQASKEECLCHAYRSDLKIHYFSEPENSFPLTNFNFIDTQRAIYATLIERSENTVFIKRKSKPRPENSFPFRKLPLNRTRFHTSRVFEEETCEEIQYSNKARSQNQKIHFLLHTLTSSNFQTSKEESMLIETSENTVFKRKLWKTSTNIEFVSSRHPKRKDRGEKIRYTKLDGGEGCEEGGNQVRRFSATTEP